MGEPVQFRIMGPLEVVGPGRPVGLGGTKQRATLAYLLLHANRVVATSELVNALWPLDDSPTSARKILQNAVWGLRRILQPYGVELVTQPPGYKLVVDQDSIDFHRFQRDVRTGRQLLADGQPDRASRVLRDALALWRGPALADLAEAGIDWPERVTMQNARLDATEDYFDAELACGRHSSVITGLETVLDGPAVRERSCGQLMLALYRAGRQADALSLYGSVRARLVNELGLEPGGELQALQQAILTQDASLNLPARAKQPPVAEPAPPPGGPSWEISVLLVRTKIAPFRSARVDELDEMIDDVTRWVRETVEHFGGVVTATIGSVSVAQFDAEDNAQLAVLAALAIRDGLNESSGPVVSPGIIGFEVSTHVAIATGGAVTKDSADPPTGSPWIAPTLLDSCHSLLAVASAGQIRVSAATRDATKAMIEYDICVAGAEYAVKGVHGDYVGHDVMPTVEREFELSLVRNMFNRAAYRMTPHLITVLGEPGTGKTRFLTELDRSIGKHSQVAHVVVGRTPLSIEDGVYSVQSKLVSALCGIGPQDTRADAQEKLVRTVRAMSDDEAGAQQLYGCLGFFFDPASAPAQRLDAHAELDQWRRFLGRTALRQPLVLVIDDLHRADDELLDFINGLVDFTEMPLLVVASARPDLLRRRGHWSGGKQHSAMITLETLSDDAVDQLIDHVVSAEPPERKNSMFWFHRALRATTSGGAARRSYFRSLLSMGPPRKSRR